jgi:chromosome segregation ATPase
VATLRQERNQLRAELEKQTTERSRLEAQWQEHTNTLKAAIKKAVAASLNEGKRSRNLEAVLARLQQEHGALEAKLTAEQEKTAQTQQRLEGLEKQAKERERLESELNAVKVAGEETRIILKGEVERTRQQTEQVDFLIKEREDLTGRVASAQQAAAAAQQRAEELEKRLQERAAEWGEQLKTTKAAAEKAEAARLEESERGRRQEEQLKGLQQEREALSGQLAAQQQAATEARQRAEELETRLGKTVTELERAKAEQKPRNREQGRLKSELEEAKAAAQQATASLQEEAQRRRQVEEELAGHRQAREELGGQLAAEQLAAATARQRAQELEARLQQSVAALDQARTQVPPPRASGDQPTNQAPEALGLELGALTQQAELAELEQRIRDGVISLARTTADLEKERGERRRMEQRNTTLASQLQELHEELKQHLASERSSQNRLAELEHQVHEREQAMSRSSADVHKERTERQLAEQQLRASGDLSGQLRNCLAAFEEAQKAFKRRQEELQARLQASLHTVSESEARLQKETSERQRLEEALAAAQRQVQEQTENTAMECSRLQSVLELEQSERKRLEGNALQSRYASLDSTRVGLTMMNRLRRQIRPPVDQLLESTRHLLELPLEEEPKKLIETVLENALLLQSNLQESTSLNTGPADGPGDALSDPGGPATPGS